VVLDELADAVRVVLSRHLFSFFGVKGCAVRTSLRPRQFCQMTNYTIHFLHNTTR
jgi:hypothetical protein